MLLNFVLLFIDRLQVRFHPSAKSFLLTGGVDGLVNVFDIDEACEDDALLYTLNAECAVVRRKL